MALEALLIFEGPVVVVVVVGVIRYGSSLVRLEPRSLSLSLSVAAKG